MNRTTDCVAESPDQLMYITGDTLILLREEEEVVIAACEGVVGWIKRGDVDFKSFPSGSIADEITRGQEHGGTKLEVPNTIISSPTPPTKTVELPPLADADGVEVEVDEGGLEVDHRSPDSRRASGPFDLGTPNHSPGLDQGEVFFEKVDKDVPPLPQVVKGEGEAEANRASVLSTASSDALGGIGGFMMGSSGDGESFISRDGDGDGDGQEDGDTREDLKGASIL